MNHSSMIDVGRIIDVGTQSPEFQQWAHQQWSYPQWETVTVCYHAFAHLPTTRGEFVTSPEFTCLGRPWRLRAYPGGDMISDDDMIAAYLYNLSNDSVKIDFTFCIKDSTNSNNGNSTTTNSSSSSSSISRKPPSTHTFGPFGTPEEGNGAGCRNLAVRSTLLNSSLVGGALLIEVRMKLATTANATLDNNNVGTVAFVPENPFVRIMLASFMDGETADVVFEVEDKDDGDDDKDDDNDDGKNGRPKTIDFHAHRLILQKCGAQLAELCGTGTSGTTSETIIRVSIGDVKPVVFRHMLHYIYGATVPPDILKAYAREIIDAADKYGIANLKLEAEACLVRSTRITVANAMDHLLYADAKNCALLKEAAVDFVVENKLEVLERVSLGDAPGGLLADILAAVARGDGRSNAKSGSRKGEPLLSTMAISDLRRRAYEKGLDVDGSREALIASLKENS